MGIDDDVLEILDGLVIIGGPDIDPSQYGAEPHPETDPKPLRDDFEIGLARAALARDLPLLAICRGAQILNVAMGGTLHQHLPEITDRAHEYRPSPGEYGRVGFTSEPGSICRGLLGERAWSPCYHHQALDRVADGLSVTATADDGTIEVVEADGRAWVVGVQFHPEENRGDPGSSRASSQRLRSARKPQQTLPRTTRRTPLMSSTEILNPATGETITQVEQTPLEDVDAAIARAKRAFESWRAVDPADRARLLRRFADAVEADIPHLADLEVRSAGHTIGNATWEAGNVRDVLTYYAGGIERQSGRQIPVPGGVNITFHEPLGVVG